ncbi:hypothetical protein BVC80_379g24 [Macleaya cordata]|uniref:2Fe-2S ferredoxin-type domain-containing protein n=1 Tax=Macleaya cordata TaxID=56857 RepID=A0A200QSR2_MACCD|nr:hypothetical protein BVC80_379g24 [Macleaya cordata]
MIYGVVFISCCTSCAVRIKSGEIRQPEALGISAELKAKGYALLCVGFPSSDIEVETQDEDEVYWLQFGRYFARGPIERDDYALELAMGDEPGGPSACGYALNHYPWNAAAAAAATSVLHHQ